MRLKGYISLRIFLPALFILGAMGIGSCGGGGSGDSGNGQGYTPPPVCNLDSQRNEHRLHLEREPELRDEISPKRFSRDFEENYGADISPTQIHRDIAKKVSRSVFDMEFREDDGKTIGLGTGWLIAPEYVVTAAHALIDNDTGIKKRIEEIFIYTFDGDRIEVVETEHVDEKVTEGSDLALVRLKDPKDKERIDAVPLKIADEVPGRNEFLMAMGGGLAQKGIGAWTVSAGPALELKSGSSLRTDKMYHAVPTSKGMSGGPIFNEKGEVVSIVSGGSPGDDKEEILRKGFGVMPSQVPEYPVEDLWVYAFEQPPPNFYSTGPSIEHLKEYYEKIPEDEKPDNAGEYRDNNTWETGDEFGGKYSPFPLDQFKEMNGVYKKASEAAVIIRIEFVEKGDRYALEGSGFIYDKNTVVTVGHATDSEGDSATVTTYYRNGEKEIKKHHGKVVKSQDSGLGGCDIAVIKMDPPLSEEYHTLQTADPSSLKCGDPLVVIGSGDIYDSVGPLQGVGAVYMRTQTYVSEFFSPFTASGMSGGPVVDRNGKVVSISSTIAGRVQEDGEEEGRWTEPGPLLIRTHLPVYFGQDFSEGPNAETIKRFVTEDGYRCPE